MGRKSRYSNRREEWPAVLTGFDAPCGPDRVVQIGNCAPRSTVEQVWNSGDQREYFS